MRERASLERDEVAVIQLVSCRHLLAVDQGQLTRLRAGVHVGRVGVSE